MADTLEPSPVAPVHVAAAVIEDARGRVLLSRRAPGSHQGGLWEFPGGKVEETEPFSEALARELKEELGIETLAHEPLIRIRHDYPDKSVLLDVHRVREYTGRPEGCEGQPLAWVAPGDLGSYPMPAADRPIVAAVRLPDAYLVTGDCDGDANAFLRRLDRALERGARLVQLRTPSLQGDELVSLARACAARCRRFDARLLLNAEPALVEATGADGVHLNSRRLAELDARPLGDDLLVAASCHDGRELARAERVGADFAVLSPVLATASHPGAKTLGWAGFERLVERATIPVYPLGGLGIESIAEARRRGGQGVAGIRAFW